MEQQQAEILKGQEEHKAALSATKGAVVADIEKKLAATLQHMEPPRSQNEQPQQRANSTNAQKAAQAQPSVSAPLKRSRNTRKWPEGCLR